MCPGHLFNQENSDKALFSLNLEISAWPLRGVGTLLFSGLVPHQFCWFRTVPFEISNPTWLTGGVPITANIAQWNRASSWAVQAGRPGRCGAVGLLTDVQFLVPCAWHSRTPVCTGAGSFPVGPHGS